MFYEKPQVLQMLLPACKTRSSSPNCRYTRAAKRAGSCGPLQEGIAGGAALGALTQLRSPFPSLYSLLQGLSKVVVKKRESSTTEQHRPLLMALKAEGTLGGRLGAARLEPALH